MTLYIDAIYDGKSFRPIKPVNLKPNTKVRIVVDENDEDASVSFFDVARSIQIDGPADWSEKIDEYLYGKYDLNEQ